MAEDSSSQQVSTRRKSCVACVKAKRRCDLQKPFCTRCNTRGLLCNYPGTNCSDIGNVTSQFLDLAFEIPSYTNIPSPAYQFDDIVNPSLIPLRNVQLSKEKLDSCVQYFKNYITNIVRFGRTPFINPQIYNDGVLPPCLQDVYCVCAAYLTKNPMNEALVFSILSNKLNDLFSKLQYCSLEDELASVQALIIYQIIRLFDGDIRQRGMAEAHFQLMTTWAMHLRQRSEFELPPSMQSSPYRKWLFIESARRTVLMAIFVRAIYCGIRDGYCSSVPELAVLPLTVRGGLWEVKSENEWMQATCGSQPDVLTYHEFVEAFDGGGAGGGVEDFQKALLVACIGEDGIQNRFLESLTRDLGWT